LEKLLLWAESRWVNRLVSCLVNSFLAAPFEARARGGLLATDLVGPYVAPHTRRWCCVVPTTGSLFSIVYFSFFSPVFLFSLFLMFLF
jgi:hypothetical protein